MRTPRLAALLAIGIAFGSLSVRAAQAQQAEAPTASAVPIPADQQASKEQLRKLFQVMRLQQQLDSFLKRIPTMVQQQIKAQTKQMTASLPNGESLTPQQQAAVDKITSKYMQKAVNTFTVDEMIEDLIPIYQRHLSASDVDAFIAFYQSPAGQHLLDQQPAIMEEYMPVAIQHAQEHSKQLTDDLARELTAAVKPTAPVQGKPAPK